MIVSFVKALGSMVVPRPLFSDSSIPNIVSLEEISYGSGWGNDTLYLFKTSNPDGYVIMESPIPDLYSDGSKVGNPYGVIGGYGVYNINLGAIFMLQDALPKIVMFGYLRQPYATYDDDTETWIGDGWHEGAHNVLEPKGTLLNGSGASSITLSYKINGYQIIGTDKYGIYNGIGEKQGATFTFGDPYWRDDNERKYIRSSVSPLRFTGTIYAGGKYIIGTYGSQSGWWESEAPTEQSSWVFSFKKPSGSEAPAQPGKTLEWGGWREGVNKVLVGVLPTNGVR